MIFKVRPLVFFLFLICFFSVAHANSDDIVLDSIDSGAYDLYNEGLMELNLGNYAIAKEKLEDMVSTYPFIKMSEKARVLLVFIYFILEDYDSVELHVTDYISFYPNGDDIAYMHYMRALNMFIKIPDFSVDLDNVSEARDYFSEVIRKFPSSRYHDSSKRKIAFIDERIAAKEKENALRNLSSGNYIAALKGFNYLLNNYGRTKYAEEALFRCFEACSALGLTEEAAKYKKTLKHNFPKSIFVHTAG